MAAPPPHPLKQLSVEETNVARDVTLGLHDGVVLEFREIYLQEPPKVELVKFLDLEHEGKVTNSTPRPPRLARVQYDVIGGGKGRAFHESVIDITHKARVSHDVVSSDHQASLTG
jgi:primary-amine oxidase